MRACVERVVVAVWDNLPLPVQHVLFDWWRDALGNLCGAWGVSRLGGK